MPGELGGQVTCVHERIYHQHGTTGGRCLVSQFPLTPRAFKRRNQNRAAARGGGGRLGPAPIPTHPGAAFSP